MRESFVIGDDNNKDDADDNDACMPIFCLSKIAQTCLQVFPSLITGDNNGDGDDDKEGGDDEWGLHL